MSKRNLALAFALLALIPASARAMTCSFGSAVGASFGSYNVFDSSPLDSTGSVAFSCSGAVADFVTIDISTGSSSSYAARTLQKGADALSYNLYTDAARSSNVWGDGTGGSSHYGPVQVVLGQETTVTVYGRVPARQNVPAGSYSDTVIVTINY